MQLKYKIIEANAAEHSIVVRYTTDQLSAEDLSLNIVDGQPVRNEAGEVARCRTDYNLNLPYPAPTGAALEQFIVGCAPTHWLEVQGALKAGNSDPVMPMLIQHIGTEYTPGTTAGFVPTEPLPQELVARAKVVKKQEIAAWRYRIEVSGISVNGARILTDRESQAQLTGALMSLQAGLLQSINWKDANGAFVALTLMEVQAIATAVAQHVQSSFDAEKDYCAQVDAAATVEEVQAITLP
jgi:hypothetical protein